jgi:protein involved in polysaccharide export with SLBB domain
MKPRFSTIALLLLLALGAAPAAAQQPRVVPAAAFTDSPPPGTAEYRLAPGDVVKVSVGSNAVERELSREGKISVPRAGDVAIGGLTRVGAEQAVSERLNARGVRQSDVEVSVTRFRQ